MVMSRLSGASVCSVGDGRRGAMGQAKRRPRAALGIGAMEFAILLVGIWSGRQAVRTLGVAVAAGVVRGTDLGAAVAPGARGTGRPA